MVHDVSVCRRAFELVSVKYPRTAASPMADVRRPPPRCTEITCTAIFVCILDRGRFWGVDTARASHPARAQAETERNVGRERAFTQVDVFAARRYGGILSRSSSTATVSTDIDMARFATWTNLSETTYVTTPKSQGADFGLRFFPPHGELPFAGHPTLGSVHAWLESGGKPGNGDVVVLECGVGLVDVRRTGDTLSFRGPALRRTGPLDDDYLDRIARGLRIDRSDILDHNWVDNGPGWAAVRLASAADVLGPRTRRCPHG